MIKNIFFAAFCLLLLFSQKVIFAQKVYTTPETNFLKGIKDIEEFMKRFNHDKTLLKNYTRVKSQDTTLFNFYKTVFGKDTVERKEMLATTFERNNFSKMDTTMLRKFLTEITDEKKNIQLQFKDDDWYAEVTCQIQYKQHDKPQSPADIILILRYEYDKITDGNAWVIVACFSTLLRIESEDTKKVKGIKPTSSEFNFADLGVAFKDKKNIERVTDLHFQPDMLSVFLYAVKNDIITFGSVKNIKYHFLQIDDWIFTVENYKRDTPNSGWLISSVIPATNDYKKKYVNTKLYIQAK
jgi:hypothetical protein